MNKKEIIEILYKQLELLDEKMKTETDNRTLSDMLCDFRQIGYTVLSKNPTEEQRDGIFKMASAQIKLLSEKKSVYFSDCLDALAVFMFRFF